MTLNGHHHLENLSAKTRVSFVSISGIDVIQALSNIVLIKAKQTKELEFSTNQRA